jgi:carbon storage regulator
MLVLTRHPGESIQLDQHITVVVLEVRGDQVRIGIDAPKEVTIVRTELLSSRSEGKRIN